MMYFFIFILIFDQILYANSADPDQKPRYVASDLGLHCLPRFPKRDASLIWINFIVAKKGSCKFWMNSNAAKINLWLFKNSRKE